MFELCAVNDENVLQAMMLNDIVERTSHCGRQSHSNGHHALSIIVLNHKHCRPSKEGTHCIGVSSRGAPVQSRKTKQAECELVAMPM